MLRNNDTGEWRTFVLDIRAISASAWISDGKRLLLRGRGFRQPGLPEREGLFWLDVASGALEPFDVGADQPGRPRCSSDGRTVFFDRPAPNGGRTIVVRDLATGEARDLVTNAVPVNFDVSRDARWIAFVEVSGRQQHLRVVSTTGGEPRDVTRFGAAEYVVPAGWSPSGEHVIVAIRSDAAIPPRDAPRDTPWPTDLWAIRIADGERRRLGEVRLVAPRSFRLSPDGTQVSFEAGDFESSNWVMERFIPTASPAARAARKP